jgi:hypothetical protein
LPFASYLTGMEAALPVVGATYQGYVVWKRGEATKYYAFDPETTYRAVMKAAAQLKLGTTVTKSLPKEGYALETGGTVPMRIEIKPVEQGVTSVIINIATFGDKNYVELFYRLVDDHLLAKPAAGKEKSP